MARDSPKEPAEHAFILKTRLMLGLSCAINGLGLTTMPVIASKVPSRKVIFLV